MIQVHTIFILLKMSMNHIITDCREPIEQSWTANSTKPEFLQELLPLYYVTVLNENEGL